MAAALLISCNSKKPKQETTEKKVITVSILPQRTFVEKIAGDEYEINVLLPPGVNPHSFEMLPAQLKSISKSVLWFRIGHIGFEYSWKEKIIQANTSMKVVDVSEGLDLIHEDEEQHGEHTHVGGIDPHIWISPQRVKQIAERMAGELTLLNPANGPVYKKNLETFLQEIDALDAQIRNELKPFEGRKFITFHPSLSYFAKDYGIEQLTLEFGGKEPTPQHMAEVVEMARKENIKAIYIQSEFDKDHATVFAKEIDGTVIQVVPLDPNWAENLLFLTRVLVENF